MDEYENGAEMDAYACYEKMNARKSKETKPIDDRLKQAYYDLNEHESAVKKTKSKIKRLHAAKNREKGEAQPSLNDKELKYGVIFALENSVPTTKAFHAVAINFGHDSEWIKKVLRYRPIKAQVRRVLDELMEENNPSIKTMEEFVKVDLNQLITSYDVSNLINNLKRMLKLAQSLSEQKAEIMELKKTVSEQGKVIQKLVGIRRQTLLLPQHEAIKALRKEFPEIKKSEIAKEKGMDRKTVSRYLKSCSE